MKSKFSFSKKNLALIISLFLLLISPVIRNFLRSYQTPASINKDYSLRLKAVEKLLNNPEKIKKSLKSPEDKKKDLDRVAEYEYFYQNGIELYQKGKLAESVNTFENALKTKDTEEIRNMLAQVYNLLGFKETEKKNYDKAVKFFEKSFNASNNLQSLLAISNAYILKGDIDKAQYSLEKTSELYPKDPRVFYNLGQIYYQKGDEEKAKVCFEKALELNPKDSKTETALKSLKSSFGIDEDFLQKGFDNFQFDTSGTANNLTQDIILTLLQKSYEKVGNELGIFFKSKINILLDYNTPLTAATPAPNKNLIIDIDKIKIPVAGFKKSTEVMENAIAYSYTKFALSSYTEGKCPAWFVEGLSLYECSYESKNNAALIRDMISSGNFIKLESLSVPFQNLDSKYLPMAYALSFSAIDYVLTKYGSQFLRELIDRIKSDMSFEKGIHSLLHISQNDFQKNFENYLKDKYKI